MMPNILLIFTDQQRFDTIGALGNPVIRTPNLDRLVAEGVAFTDATTPSPVCMAARWSLHSGQWTSTHRCYSNHHPGVRPPTDIPAMLRGAGYRAGLVGKNHSFLQPEDFDYWEEHPQPPDSSAWKERQEWVRTVQRSRYPRLVEEPLPGGIEVDLEHAKTDAALRFIRACGEEPFFLWLSYHHPHTPYMVPEPYFSMYSGASIPGPVIEPEGLSAAKKPFRQRYHQMNNDAILPFTPDHVMLTRQVYYGMISLIDAETGRVLDYLEGHGLAEDTLVLFTSDHGDYLGDHGLMTKSPSLYDCLVRVPLIVRWPGRIEANRRDNQSASLIDLMPTLAAAAGIPCPEQAQGVDLLSYLGDGDEKGQIRPAAFSEYGVPGIPYDEERLAAEGLGQKCFTNPWHDALPWEGNPVSLAGRIRMVRTREWKYVEETRGTCELYDLVRDPYELVNLWNEPEHALEQEELENCLGTFKRQLCAPETG